MTFTELGDQLLIVATDRLSAFDVVLPTGIPDKGRVLTQMSIFWFEHLREVTDDSLPQRRCGRLSGRAEAFSCTA